MKKNAIKNSEFVITSKQRSKYIYNQNYLKISIRRKFRSKQTKNVKDWLSGKQCEFWKWHFFRILEHCEAERCFLSELILNMVKMKNFGHTQGPRNGFHLGVARSKYKFCDSQFSKKIIEWTQKSRGSQGYPGYPGSEAPVHCEQ